MHHTLYITCLFGEYIGMICTHKVLSSLPNTKTSFEFSTNATALGMVLGIFYWKRVFNSAITHLSNLYHRISSTNNQLCIACAKSPASNAHDLIFGRPLCTHLIVVIWAMIIRHLSPEYSVSQRCSVTEYFVVFALAVHPKHASDLAKPNMILGEGLYLSAREEIPKSNSVRTFVSISNYSPNK